MLYIAYSISYLCPEVVIEHIMCTEAALLCHTSSVTQHVC